MFTKLIVFFNLCSDIETSNNVKRPKSLALFIPSDNKLPNLVNEDKVAIKNCIADLNCNNSGIVFSLCKSICDFISHDLEVDSITNETRNVLDNDTLSIITDTIALLDLRFVEYILSNVNLSLEEKMKVIKMYRPTMQHDKLCFFACMLYRLTHSVHSIVDIENE